MRTIRFCSIFLVVMLLVGCVPHYQFIAPLKRQQNLSKLSYWQFNGIVQVRYHGKSDTAHIYWVQQGVGKFNLHLSGPVGLYAAEFYQRSGGVMFKRGKQVLHAATLAELMHAELGWALPAYELYAWVRGVPAAGLQKKHMQFDRFGHLVSLQQGKWQLHYSQFVSVDHVDLPTNIQIQSPVMQLRLVINKWSLQQQRAAKLSRQDAALLSQV
jgi:outer membrane lipoprotein LolB